MKTPFRRFALLAIVLFAAASVGSARADDGPWQYLEAGISVHFHQVNPQNCTWDFKNTSTSQTLQSMTFTYTHPAPTKGGAYNPYDTKTDTDILPYPLKPGQVIGGWAAYLAPGSCTNVRINVTQREWK
jgi:hypothetical protein